MSYKVTVFGGTNNKNYSEHEQSECEKLGAFLGSIGADVLTGACGGFPYFVGKAAAENGSRVYGYTPAMDLAEHVDVYKFPTDGVTDLIYNDVKSATMAENFMKRSIDMTPFSDVVVALGGSWGTFFELLLSFWYKKTIILVEDFEGAVKAFDDVYKFFGERDINPDVHFGPTIIRVKNIDEAIQKIVELK
jgi:hypothetical protein